MEYSSAYTPQINIPAQGWVSPSASELWNATTVAFGSNPNPAKGLHSSSPSRSEPAGQPGQHHVLLVEDNKLDVFMVQEAFAEYQIPAVLHVVEDGDAALQFIDTVEKNETEQCPALVLLDLNLPKRSGTEVLAYLRGSKKCAAAQVVIVSSSNSLADRTAAQQPGASGYFLKPPSYNEFLKIGEIVLRNLPDSNSMKLK